ncbi:MAG: SPOR domain-containing protein [Pseudomonadota bacterium]|nr:SPOR domain-containing protein [Pseudomonadota bacterium]
MKLCSWFLVLLNAALLAYWHGDLESIWPSGHEPQRLQTQLAPDRLRLLPAVVNNATASNVAAAPAEPAPAIPKDPVPAAPPATPAPVTSCAEWGDFSDAEASRFEAQMSTLGINVKPTRRALTDATSFMVYIPPLADKESADRKSSELRRLDVKDFYVIQNAGDLRYAISLGIFKTRAAAEQHLAELVRKGVHSARVGGRGSGGDKFALQWNAVTEADLAKLSKLAQGFARVERRECAAVAR